MKYGKDYYIGGAESNYIDYPSRTYEQLAKDIEKVLDMGENDTILDYGCGTGNLTKQLNEFDNLECCGVDISKWAIKYGFHYISMDISNDIKYHINFYYSHILFLDVLEHCSNIQLKYILKRIKTHEILVRIPVAGVEKQDFVLDCSKKDKTHVQCHSKTWWRKLFKKYGFEITKVIDEKAIYDSDGVAAWVLEKN